ncbi:uncharacterized protein LOC133036011 [Cannabis sativa]|uniref:uncharacterized protein LOC133036011 n=1 Tax=Cannabis sativa TaxID=3483 RepID=UPI0029CA678E|nr:uncharacterized protein LOC133036011 [Cannabis sativa]
MEHRDEVLNGGYIFFNKRLVIMKAWDPNTNFKKEDIQTVPIWVQLTDLEMKYWGQKALFKIIGQVGEPITVDAATKERDKLSYPRVLIQVSIHQDFPGTIYFEDEYESQRQEWIVKNDKRKPDEKAQTADGEFKEVTKGWKVKGKAPEIGPSTSNSFQVLHSTSITEGNTTELLTDPQQREEIGKTGGGEIPLFPMDKIICWNVRGINNQQKQHMVKQFIANQKAGLVGLLGTRVKAPKLGALYLNMFSGWCFTSNLAWHKGGRIILAWNPNQFTVNIISCSSQFIHTRVTTFDGKYSFFATFVYGYNEEQGRQQLWKGMQDFSSTDPWIVLGDFNDILNKDERIGERVRHSSSTAFTNCVSYCQLEDIRYSGSFFTWNNKQRAEDRIYSKIDRVLANEVWIELFLTAEAIFLTEGLFDHTPAVVSIHPTLPSGRKPFKYFRMWSSHPSFQQILSTVWSQKFQGTKMYQIIAMFKALKPALKELNRCHFSDIQATDFKAKQDLDESQTQLQKDPLNSELQEQEATARKVYAEIHKNYCSFLQQKARMAWIKE